MAINYGSYGYGYNNGLQPQPQYFNNTQQQGFSTIFVSDIAEAIATKPDLTGKPLFFYNKANEEIYIKQYDNTGLAPVRTYKLALENNSPQNQTNPYIESFKSLDHKLDVIEKGNKKNERAS